jgi:hypothetical protein
MPSLATLQHSNKRKSKSYFKGSDDTITLS